MKFHAAFAVALLATACTPSEAPVERWKRYDESGAIAANAVHENVRMRYQLVQSKFQDKNLLWAPFKAALDAFGEDQYAELAPLVLEQDIPTLQGHVASGRMTYEDLTTFFLYRIRKLESDSSTTLHAVVALNPDAIEDARRLDREREQATHPIYGMPILLKDNINTAKLPTTAGAALLADHTPPSNAFIVDQLNANGALILGKVNLSEWAYFFCDDCPLGYSAVGGQTLNPYGRGKFETGGSSSGSGVAVAANYATAAIGTETSGSILSPSSMNSVVGLKPTIGLASRTGIVPISSTLDTPGPMTKTVVDNAIVLDAMHGADKADAITSEAPVQRNFLKAISAGTLEGKRLGALTELLEGDSLYAKAVDALRASGAKVIEIIPPEVSLNGFLSVLNGDMIRDLPHYFNTAAAPEFAGMDVAGAMAFNRRDSGLHMPYGQARFEGIVADPVTNSGLDSLVAMLHEEGRSFFDEPMATHGLDALISVNNYHAAYAAVAYYPGLTVPMGYSAKGEPAGLTFYVPSHEEERLLGLAAAYEAASKQRQAPLLR
ncbi:MAG: amidase [Flavobacteriales bacterium]|nr:amidase [Flavobacteriales bacterium]